MRRSATASEAAPVPRETAQPAQRSRGVRLQSVGSFDEPVYVTAPARDRRRIFVVEQGGRIRVVRGGRKVAQPFLDVSGQVRAGGEQGLLSMAFASDYAFSGLFYVDYTDTNGDSRVVEYRRASADRADPGSAREVLSQRQPEVNHNGGQLLFGPDRLMYIGFGDGGGGDDQHGARGNAQDLGTWLGKILRIDPRARDGRPYTVPSSNPFAGRDGARPEIYAYGLRNPWRFAFQPGSRALAVADVGQDAVEEVTFASRQRAKGGNFGWRPFEGRSRNVPGERAPGHIPPDVQRTHDQGWCSITGGVFVRDRALPALRGRYLFGDFCEPAILAARPGGGVRSTGLRVPSLSSFGEDARGRVYATSLEGSVYRIVPR